MSNNINTPTKAPRPKNQNRHKVANGISPTTPSKGISQNVFENIEAGEGHLSENGIGRPKRQRNPNKDNYNSKSANPEIASMDGPASPSAAARPITIPGYNQPPKSFATPAKQAYAGPTFHASPAPSALPMPKFFSKSVPTATLQSTLKARIDAEGSENNVPPSLSPHPPVPIIQREESPLDFFFNAHRAEQARKSSGGSPQPLSVRPHAANSQIPHGLSRLGDAPQSPAQYQSRPNRDALPGRKEMFMMELDGTGEQHGVGGGTGPFREHTNTVRAPSCPAAEPFSQASLDEQQRLAKSIALKNLLKGVPSPSNGYTNSPQHAASSQPSYGYPQHMGDASHPRWTNADEYASHDGSNHQSIQHVEQGLDTTTRHTSNSVHGQGGTPPTQGQTRTAPDVKSMEADLKRMLRLA